MTVPRQYKRSLKRLGRPMKSMLGRFSQELSRSTDTRVQVENFASRCHAREQHRSSLKRDWMWHLNEVGLVARTAFLTRTTAPTLDPLGDGWSQQDHNDSPRLASVTWMKAHAPERPRSLWRLMRGPE